MKLLLRFSLFLLVALQVAQASQRTAWQARAELGPEIWAEVLRIKNENPQSVYPATVYATVFEFNGILWFYTDTNGTQSFSLHRDRLKEEKADFAPLLRAIDPGFVSAEVLPEPTWAPGIGGPLPNGCFIDSLAALRRVLATDPTITGAALLSYYVGTNKSMRGHTVLVYETSIGFFTIDSAISASPVRLSSESLHDDAVKVARLVTPFQPATARWVPVSLRRRDESSATQVAALPVNVRGGIMLVSSRNG